MSSRVPLATLNGPQNRKRHIQTGGGTKSKSPRRVQASAYKPHKKHVARVTELRTLKPPGTSEWINDLPQPILTNLIQRLNVLVDKGRLDAATKCFPYDNELVPNEAAGVVFELNATKMLEQSVKHVFVEDLTPNRIDPNTKRVFEPKSILTHPNIVNVVRTACRQGFVRPAQERNNGPIHDQHAVIIREFAEPIGITYDGEPAHVVVLHADRKVSNVWPVQNTLALEAKLGEMPPQRCDLPLYKWPEHTARPIRMSVAAEQSVLSVRPPELDRVHAKLIAGKDCALCHAERVPSLAVCVWHVSESGSRKMKHARRAYH